MKNFKYIILLEVSIGIALILALHTYAGPVNIDVEPLPETYVIYQYVEAVKRTKIDDPSEVKIVEEPPVEEVKYFDVDLDEELQDYIFELCADVDIDPAIVIAMIQKESGFDIKAVGDKGNSLGLMQIQPRWNKARMDKLECTDLLDPYQNLKVGIDILAELIAEDKSIEWALMAYNGGHAYANRLVSEGRVSEYAEEVIRISNELERK